MVLGYHLKSIKSTPSWLKVRGGVGWVVGGPCDYRDSHSPLGWDLRIGDWGQGLSITFLFVQMYDKSKTTVIFFAAMNAFECNKVTQVSK